MQDIVSRFQNSMKVYCKYCGKQLIMSNTDETGSPIDSAMEMQARACTRCLDKAGRETRAKMLEVQAQEAPKKEFSADAMAEVLKHMPAVQAPVPQQEPVQEEPAPQPPASE